MNILITVDDNYIDVALNMLFSLRLYNENLTIHSIYDDSLSKKSIEKLKNFIESNDIGELKLYYIDSKKLNLSVIKSEYITKTCYLRLFSPFIIKDVDRLLYLDPDIVCQGSLEEFYNTDLGNYIIAGCRNMLRSDVVFLHYDICERLKLPFDLEYINSGVLLIDTKKYRDFAPLETINEFLQKNKNILDFQDQDTINSIFFLKIKVMDNTYNYQINAADYWNVNLDSVLIHYSEGKKPWKDTYPDTYRALPYYVLLLKMGKVEEAKRLIHAHSKNNEDRIIELLYNNPKPY